MTSARLDERWRAFYRDRCRADIQALARDYPDDRSLFVDVFELYEYDEEFTRTLFAEPAKTLEAARRALAAFHDAFDRVNVRVTNHPGLLGLRSLRTHHVGELVSVEGVVTDVGPVRAAVRGAAFECRRCGDVRRHDQSDLHLDAPVRCPACGEYDAFRFRRDRSTFVDVQRVELSESRDDRQEDRTERSLPVVLDDDVVGTVGADRKLRATGLLRLDERADENRFDFYVDAVTVTPEVDTPPQASAETALKEFIESRW